MQDILEIIYMLSQNNLHALNQMGQPIEEDSKMGVFLEGLRSGKINSDEDAIALLYPEAADSANYRKLKSNLRDRLMDSVYQFDSQKGNYSDYQKAYYECNRKWLIIKILTGQNANTPALYLAKKILKDVEKYEFTMLGLDLASFLMIQYSIHEGNDKKYTEASKLFDRYVAIYKAECMAEKLYAELVSKQVNNSSSTAQIHKEAVRSFQLLQPFLEQYKSFKLQLYGNIIGLTTFTAVNDFQGAMDFCRQCIQVFKVKPYSAAVPLQVFNYQQLLCCIQLKQFDEGQKAAKYCFSVTREGTFNWFKCQELYTKLCIHTQQYEQAHKVLDLVYDHDRFQFMPPHTKEIWLIYDYYLAYLSAMGQTPPRKGAVKFKAGKFENELPIFSKDKSGMNIPKIVIKFLFLLQTKAYSQILDETEAIEQYCYRHLNGRGTQRSLCFIKLLLQISHNGFDLESTRQRTKKLVDKLKEISLQVANQNNDVEIVPYEHLWTLALLSLSKRADARRSPMA